jgi:hypothetical protein
VRLDVDHPANIDVLRALERASHNAVPFMTVAEFGDAYYAAGAHPDCVARLWEIIAQAVSSDMRCLVYNRPALVHESSGVLLGFCMGTQYALRIPVEDHATAIERGCHRAQKWGVKGSGNITDLRAFGADWLFGAYLAEEIDWFRKSHEAYA